MTFDFDEFEKLQAKRNGERLKERESQLTALVRAAVPTERLTSNPDWNTYLSYLQGLVEETEKVVKQLEVQLNEGEVYEHASMLLLKSRIQRGKERIAAFTLAMEIPGRLKEGALEAKDLLKKLESLTTDVETT